jgi:hypothetical protein
MSKFANTAKAIASGVVATAAYLAGVVPAEGGFGDLTLAQWLGGVVVLGSAYGITYAVPPAGRGTRVDSISRT